MNWIKRNYDQFILALVALILLALSGLLINNAIGFQATFAGIRGEVFHNNNVPPVDLGPIQDAVAAIQAPAKWQRKSGQGSLFVSIPYTIIGDKPVDPSTSTTMLHPPVPNSWIIDHKLDILDSNVLNEDPSNDGFTNLDKWKGLNGDGSDAFDPQDKASHPPYWTKLRLKQYIKIPFRLLFNAYDGDIKQPDSLQFQINTVDVQQPTQFVKIGDTIAGTKFKVIGFAYKEVPDPNTGSKTDVSELTVQNSETGDDVILVLERIVDSPDSYADFVYLWNSTEFKVRERSEFVLLPEPNLRYKLVDITEDHALIQTPTGQKVSVPRLQ